MKFYKGRKPHLRSFLSDSTMTLSNVKAIIFDVDGTLYTGGLAKYLIFGDIWRCMWALRERQTRKAMKSRDYVTAEDYYDAFFQTLSLKTGKDIDTLKDWYFNRYMPLMVEQIGKHCKVRPHINEVLAALKKKGIRLLVYSDYTRSKEKIESLGIDSSVFEKFYCAEELGALKPQARPFAQICDMNGLEYDSTLMVGDKVESDGGALDAGLMFICIAGKKYKTADKRKYNIVSWEDFVSVCMK